MAAALATLPRSYLTPRRAAALPRHRILMPQRGGVDRARQPWRNGRAAQGTARSPGPAMKIRRALLSVYDKTGIEELALLLAQLEVELLATGGTAKALEAAAIPYRRVEEFTGSPEAFGGRVKTLSFRLESALLYDRDQPEQVAEAAQLGIEPVDLVVCNFYPFEQVAAGPACEADLVEHIDIGGPTMVRSAAKNFRHVAVVTRPGDYRGVMAELLQSGGRLSLETRRQLMKSAWHHVLEYDRAIVETFSRVPLRYGENPHQHAVFVPDALPGGIDWNPAFACEAELSYNNFLDANAAYVTLCELRGVAPQLSGCVIVKHNNPCGAALAPSPAQALADAWQGDPLSAFGGVVAMSGKFDSDCLDFLEGRFVEVILASDFDRAAAHALLAKKKKVRLLRMSGQVASTARQRSRVEGGTLVQNPDFVEDLHQFAVATAAAFPAELLPVARLAVIVAKGLKSNAVAIARRAGEDRLQLVGIGSGQPNRVDAIARLALPKAQAICGDLSGCVLASDAFFPFADNVREAHRGGLRYLVQPGGSIKDAEVIATCDELGVAMALTGRRHFRH